MLKRIVVVALAGSAIILNTMTVFVAGSAALAPVKSVATAIKQLSDDRIAGSKSKPSVVLKQPSMADSSPQVISKVRNLVGRSGEVGALIVR